MTKPLWLKCLLVGIGLWVVGLVYAALFGFFIASFPALGILLTPLNWLIFGFAAIKLVKWVG